MYDICIAGIGAMGYACAKTFLSEGVSTCGWNRTEKPFESLKVFSDFGEALGASRVIIFFITSNPQLTWIKDMIYENLQAFSGKNVILGSSSSPKDSREIEEKLKTVNCSYIACAFLAPPRDVGSKNCLIFVSGDAIPREEAKSLLKPLGTIIDLGNDSGHAAAYETALLLPMFMLIHVNYFSRSFLEKENLDTGIYDDLLLEMLKTSFPEVFSVIQGTLKTKDFQTEATTLFSVKTMKVGLGLWTDYFEFKGLNYDFMKPVLEKLSSCKDEKLGVSAIYEQYNL